MSCKYKWNTRDYRKTVTLHNLPRLRAGTLEGQKVDSSPYGNPWGQKWYFSSVGNRKLFTITGDPREEKDCSLSCVISKSEFKVIKGLKRKNKTKASDEVKETVRTI